MKQAQAGRVESAAGQIGLGLLYALLYFLLQPAALTSFTRELWRGTSGDAGFCVWMIQRILQRGWWASLATFDAGYFHPFEHSLAFTDSFLIPAAAVKAFMALGLNFVPAYNLVMLAAQVLTGYCTYRLARYLGARHDGAWLAGAAFMNLPYLGAHLMHPHLYWAFFLPLTLLVTLRLWDTTPSSRPERQEGVASPSDSVGAGDGTPLPRVGFALLLGLFWPVAFLTSVYYALFSILLAAVVSLGCLLARRHALSVRAVLQNAAVFLPGLALTALCARPYVAVRQELGPWTLYEVKYFAAPLAAYLPSWLGGPAGSLPDGVDQLYPGLALYALAVVGFWRIRPAEPALRARFAAASKWLAACVAAVLGAWGAKLAGGSAVFVRAMAVAGFFWTALAFLLAALYRGGRTNSPSASGWRRHSPVVLAAVFFLFGSLGILVGPFDGPFDPGLGRLLNRFVPGFDGLRVQSRLGLVALLVVCGLAGLGASRLLERLRSGWARALALGLLVVLVTQDRRGRAFVTEPPVTPPPSLARFAQGPGPEAVLMLPVADVYAADYGYAYQQVRYLLQLLPAGRRVVNGYSSRMPRHVERLRENTIGFPDERSLDYLKSIPGLGYIVYDASGLSAGQRAAFEQACGRYADRLQVADRDEQGYYLLRRRDGH